MFSSLHSVHKIKIPAAYPKTRPHFVPLCRGSTGDVGQSGGSLNSITMCKAADILISKIGHECDI